MIQIQITEELTLTDHGHQTRTTYTINRGRCAQPLKSDNELRAAVARGIEKAITAARSRRDTGGEETGTPGKQSKQ